MKNELTADDVILAWTSEMDKKLAERPEGIWRGMAFSNQALQLLAKGKPVSPQQLAKATEISLEGVKQIIAEIKAQGGEVDEDGNLIGRIV